MVETTDALLLYGTIDVPSGQDDLVELAVGRLGALLARPPIGASIRIEKLPDALRKQAVDALSKNNVPLHHATADIHDMLFDRYQRFPSLVLVAREDSWLADRCRRKCPHADWGLNCGRVAFVYGPHDPAIFWHEALHCFGAEDCYNTKDPEREPGPTCECPRCVMQYAPTGITETDWPFLCGANVDRVKTRLRPPPSTTGNPR